MKALSFYLLLLSAACPALAQSDSVTNNILTTKKFRKGIYRDFHAFRNNSPNVETGFRIVPDTGKYDRYFLYADNGKNIRDVYGFSDGTDLFVNAQIYCKLFYYVRIEVLGPISYFEDQLGKINAMSNRGNRLPTRFLIARAVDAIARNFSNKKSSTNSWVIYLADSDGQAYLFDQNNLLSIFKEGNRPLYEKLKAEKDKDDLQMLIRYVDEFNKLAQK